MRFIRDIINETRTQSEEAQVAAPGAASQPLEPLVLQDPEFPQPSPSAEPMRQNATSAATEIDFDDFDEDEDAELEAMMRSLEEEDTEAQATLPTPDMQSTDDSASVVSDATDDLPDGDPFERLLVPQIAQVGENPPVSPLRSLRRTPGDRLSAPQTDRAAALNDVSSTPDEPSVDALTPLADATVGDAPTVGRSAVKSGRVKTRLLGFSAGAIERKDPFEKPASLGTQFPVGWLVVTSDKGRGACFALQDGVSKIGRGTDQTVCLDFGDNSISRDNHLSIAFDAEQNKFFVGHSGKSNLVRLNNKPLLSTEELRSKDMIRLGETTLRFVALCEEDFGWDAASDQVARHA